MVIPVEQSSGWLVLNQFAASYTTLHAEVAKVIDWETV